MMSNYKTLGSIEIYPTNIGYMNWYEATKACDDLGDGWRLPTKSELNVMFLNRESIGGFEDVYYWSSSQVGRFGAVTQYFTNGNQYVNSPKSYTLYVRPVRDKPKGTTTIDDIVTRLRQNGVGCCQIELEAADEIERLREWGTELTKLLAQVQVCLDIFQKSDDELIEIHHGKAVEAIKKHLDEIAGLRLELGKVTADRDYLESRVMHYIKEKDAFRSAAALLEADVDQLREDLTLAKYATEAWVCSYKQAITECDAWQSVAERLAESASHLARFNAVEAYKKLSQTQTENIYKGKP